MKILIIDDEANIVRSLTIALEKNDYFVKSALNLKDGMSLIESESFDLVILDICVGDDSGIDFYQELKDKGATIPVIFISGNASLQDAAKAVQNGAYDFLEKPFSSEKLILTVNKCFQYYNLIQKLENLEGEDSILVGNSNLMKDLKKDIKKAANSPATILIQGESGTGKELIAKMIYQYSGRKEKSFVKVNCSAIPENLIESSLFGHKKGSFTGAINNKKGFFEEANGGTIFLDEVADLSLNAQTKLLRALQEKEIQKVGSDTAIKVDVRVIAATNKDFEDLIKKGKFREDLFYRLNVIPIKSISLRNNKEDIPLLIEYFLESISRDFVKERPVLEGEVREILVKHSWPGNIRELRNLLERLIIMASGKITISDLPHDVFRLNSMEKISLIENCVEKKYTLKKFRGEIERRYIVEFLKLEKGNISSTAKILDLERTHLHKKIKDLKISKTDYL